MLQRNELAMPTDRAMSDQRRTGWLATLHHRLSWVADRPGSGVVHQLTACLVKMADQRTANSAAYADALACNASSSTTTMNTDHDGEVT